MIEDKRKRVRMVPDKIGKYVYLSKCIKVDKVHFGFEDEVFFRLLRSNVSGRIS